MAKKVIFVEREKRTDHYHKPEVVYRDRYITSSSSSHSSGSGITDEDVKGCASAIGGIIFLAVMIGLCIAFPPLLLLVLVLFAIGCLGAFFEKCG